MASAARNYGERSEDRVNRRNGYRERPWDTRVGTISLAVPKLREGSYFPDWMKAIAIGAFVPYSATTKLRTLVAEIRGTTKPDERIVFLAHVQEPGACDNASGVGLQLEVARTLKELIDSGRLQRPQRTLTFIWGAETTMGGLWKGQNAAAFANTKAALVLDMVGEEGAAVRDGAQGVRTSPRRHKSRQRPLLWPSRCTDKD